MKKNKLILISAIVLMLFSVLSVFPQSSAIKTDKGFLFIHNGDKKSFTIEIVGKEIKPLQSETPMFTVDGNVLQILTVPITNFTNNSKGKTDEELLEMHKVWESDYLGNEAYKTKLTLETQKMTFGQTKALFWGFKRPSMNQQFDGDYFLTTIIGNDLIGIGSSTDAKVKKAEIQTFLESIMQSLKVSDKPFDIEKLSEQIRKGEIK